MYFIKDIIQRCHRHQRNKNTLKQHKTLATPSIFRQGHIHQYTAYCARNYPVLLDRLEHAEISFMPIGRGKNDLGPQGIAVGDYRYRKRLGIEDGQAERWEQSWGILIFTGIPSERDGARWHDIDFKYEAICAAPDAVIACIEALVNSVANPLLTLTKSGGLRFSCRIQGYLHPSTQEERLYIYKHTPTPENPCRRGVYLEILGESGYSRWDARYEILLGNLLDPPLIPKEALFTPLDTLRSELHEPAPAATLQAYANNTPKSLGSDNLNLAKEDFLRRKFTYLRQESGIHYWTRHGGDVSNTDVLLWEDKDTVMIRTSTPDVSRLSTQATPITEVWSDTKIVPPISTPAASDKMRAVRDGNISPLAVKRPNPVIGKTDGIKAEGTTLAGNFQKCSVSKQELTKWAANLQSEPLGNLASALLNALEIRGEPHRACVKRLRTVIQAFQSQAEEIIKQEPVFWDQINRFFSHYTRNADAPIRWDNTLFTFYIPQLNPSPKRLVSMHPEPWQAGNQVFQIRTGLYPREVILNYRDTWQVIGISEIGKRFFAGIRAEIERDPNVKHAIVSDWLVLQKIRKIITNDNVSFVSSFGEKIDDDTDIQRAAVIWIVGLPYYETGVVWEQAQVLFGSDEQPLNYDSKNHFFVDARIQSLYKENASRIISEIFGLAALNQQTNKTVMLLTGFGIPGITSRPETHLFDWEDFEIASRLDKLLEVIVTRQRFEAERDQITVTTSRQEVERILGCSSRQANRFLQKLRGGNLPRVTLREQILSFLASGEKKTAELINAIEGNPESVKHELTRLVSAKEIIRIRRGVYRSQ